MQNIMRLLDESRKIAGSSKKRPVVLFIDHYEPRIAIFELLFVCLECDLETVSTVEEALDRIGKTNYDFVLINKNLRPVDGMIATREIRKFEQSADRKASIIIGITPSDGIQDFGPCLEAGMDKCISQSIASDFIQEKLAGIDSFAKYTKITASSPG